MMLLAVLIGIAQVSFALTTVFADLNQSINRPVFRHSDHVESMRWTILHEVNEANIDELEHPKNWTPVAKIRSKRQAAKYLGVKNISIIYFEGEPLIKSSFVDCAQGENCTIKSTFMHTETVKHSGTLGIKMEAGSILEICPSIIVDKAVGNAVRTLYNFEIAGQSRARLMFRPRLMKIRGVVVMKSRCLGRNERIIGGILTLGTSELMNKDVPKCDDKYDLGPFEIIAPVSTRRGEKHDELDGEWFVEYSDNPMPVDDLNYHNVRDRGLESSDEDLKVDATVANPIMCGQYAKAYGYKVALYKNATCLLKKTLSRSDTEIYTKKGDFIGEYSLESHTSNKTQSEEAKLYWIKHRLCNMIDYAYEYYRCKKFPELPKAVIMFKKESEKQAQLDNKDVGDPIED